MLLFGYGESDKSSRLQESLLGVNSQQLPTLKTVCIGDVELAVYLLSILNLETGRRGGGGEQSDRQDNPHNAHLGMGFNLKVPGSPSSWIS